MFILKEIKLKDIIHYFLVILKNLKLLEVHDGCVGMNLNFKYEGIHYRNFFATQLLGPLLILNPYFTDYLIKLKNKDFKLEYKKDIIQNYKNRLELLENRKKYII